MNNQATIAVKTGVTGGVLVSSYTSGGPHS
jgi:hypothetical protein